MVESVINVMELAHKQIKELRTDLNDAQVYASTGMILMNGHTDQPSEMFSLETFKELIVYANEKNLGRVSFWALNRDRPCGSGVNGWVSGVCSSVAQQPYDFSKILAEFKPSSVPPTPLTPPTPPTPTPTPTIPTPTPPTPTIPTPTPTQSVTPTHVITVTSTEPVITEVNCKIEPENKYFPYKNDCHKYIRCYSKKAHLEICPEGTIYDNKLHICNFPSAVDRPECH